MKQAFLAFRETHALILKQIFKQTNTHIHKYTNKKNIFTYIFSNKQLFQLTTIPTNKPKNQTNKQTNK